jgi:hypothetical protein
MGFEVVCHMILNLVKYEKVIKGISNVGKGDSIPNLKSGGGFTKTCKDKGNVLQQILLT